MRQSCHHFRHAKPDIFALKVSGKLDKSDYERFIPVLEQAIEKHGKISLLLQIDEIDKMTAGALYNEIKFDLKHRDSFNKIAVYGTEQFNEYTQKAVDAFFTGEVKFFASESQASTWLGL